MRFDCNLIIFHKRASDSKCESMPPSRTNVDTWRWQSSPTRDILLSARGASYRIAYMRTRVRTRAREQIFCHCPWPSLNMEELPLEKNRLVKKILIANGENSTIPIDINLLVIDAPINVIDRFPASRTVNFLSMLRTIIAHYYTLCSRMICRNGRVECNTDMISLYALPWQ